MPEVIGGIEIPHTRLVSDATAVARAAQNDSLFHHCRRVFLFATAAGERLGLAADPELLYVGAMFHDLGLLPPHATDTRRFEVDSAHVARRFLRQHDTPEDEVARVFLAVALHTTPNIPEFLEPEVALLHAGVQIDLLGIGYRDLDARFIAEVIAAHPRTHFTCEMLDALLQGNIHRPQTTRGTVNADVLERFDPGFARSNFVDIVRNSAWPE
jgi:HD superfamily phosphodiesterase